MEELLGKLAKYSDQAQMEALKTVLRDKFKGSLYLTCKYLLGYGEVNNRTHGRMIRALEAATKRKLIVMPRGTFKSSIGVVGYTIWLLLNNPDLRILLDSEKYDNSKNFVREIKAKLESPLIVLLFGEFRTDNNWAEGSITIAQRVKIYRESSVTASGIGANKTGQHYDVIIHDDLNSDKNSATQELRRKVIDHVRLNVSILEPGGVMAFIGTRYAADDAIGWVLSNEIGEDWERYRVA